MIQEVNYSCSATVYVKAILRLSWLTPSAKQCEIFIWPQEDLQVEALFQRNCVYASTLLYPLSRNYLELKGISYRMLLGTNRSPGGILCSFVDEEEDIRYAYRCKPMLGAYPKQSAAINNRLNSKSGSERKIAYRTAQRFKKEDCFIEGPNKDIQNYFWILWQCCKWYISRRWATLQEFSQSFRVKW